MADAKRTCTFPGCTRPLNAAGFCSGHRAQLKSGKPLAPLRMHLSGSLSERIEARTHRTESGCWDWTGATNDRGYGQLRVAGKHLYAHRAAFEIRNGPIADGLVIDHICHNASCVNPDHLQAVSVQQNVENHNGTAKSHSRSGVRGVRWNSRYNGWEARVGHDYKQRTIGVFRSIQEAESAVIEARNRIHSNNLADRMGNG